MLEKTLEILLDCKEIVLVNPKGNEPWISIGRTDVEAPTLWPPVAKSWLMGKDLDVRKNWRQKEKGAAEDEMVREHHWLDGHEFKQTLGVGDGQGSLACCSPWGHKESDMTEPLKELNWTEAGITSHTRLHFGGMVVRRSYEIDQPHGTSVFSTQSKNKATNSLVFILKQ